MAAAAPLAGAGGIPVGLPPPAVAAAPIAPLLTFMDRYRDQWYDTENDSYQRLLTHCDPMSPHTFTAAQLWGFRPSRTRQECSSASRSLATPKLPKSARKNCCSPWHKALPLFAGRWQYAMGQSRLRLVSRRGR
jgi:hypothetical protein